VGTLPRLDHALVRARGTQPTDHVALPPPALLELPEKVVQFGTGAFLRAFVDDLIDAANRRGAFGGRVVAVSSTGSGRDARLNAQDGLYTLVVGGAGEGGAVQRECRVIASVSRALSADDAWSAVLACARNPWLELIVSNTTEVGIALSDDDGGPESPRSFPARLTRFLYERARAFAYAPSKGVVVLPCELIDANGDRLRDLVLALAHRWQLGRGFVKWVERAVPFCNTLVDRIVPGAPPAGEGERLARELGYADALLTTCEPYRLLAIEGGAAARARLAFLAAEPGVVVCGDATPYRERKVRLLNGAHTIMAPVGLLAGCETVQDAMDDELVGAFVRRAMDDEIVPSVSADGAAAFAREVLDRFANPFIRHALWDITLQGTMKVRVRVVPSIVQYAERTGRAPASLALGFAAHLLFMRGASHAARRVAGLAVPADDRAEAVARLWGGAADGSRRALRQLARAACADASLWGWDLTTVPGFADAVAEHLLRMDREGVRAALEAHLAGEAARATSPA
jgi:tagaturonate reductase